MLVCVVLCAFVRAGSERKLTDRSRSNSGYPPVAGDWGRVVRSCTRPRSGIAQRWHRVASAAWCSRPCNARQDRRRMVEGLPEHRANRPAGAISSRPKLRQNHRRLHTIRHLRRGSLTTFTILSCTCMISMSTSAILTATPGSGMSSSCSSSRPLMVLGPASGK